MHHDLTVLKSMQYLMAGQDVPSTGILHCSDRYLYYWAHRAQFKLSPNAC
jgi:hypothetical protein